MQHLVNNSRTFTGVEKDLVMCLRPMRANTLSATGRVELWRRRGGRRPNDGVGMLKKLSNKADARKEEKAKESDNMREMKEMGEVNEVTKVRDGSMAGEEDDDEKLRVVVALEIRAILGPGDQDLGEQTRALDGE